MIFTPEHDSIQASSSNCVFIYFLYSVSFDCVDSSQLTTQKYWRSYCLFCCSGTIFSLSLSLFCWHFHARRICALFSAKNHTFNSKLIWNNQRNSLIFKIDLLNDKEKASINYFIFLFKRRESEIWNLQVQRASIFMLHFVWIINVLDSLSLDVPIFVCGHWRNVHTHTHRVSTKQSAEAMA